VAPHAGLVSLKPCHPEARVFPALKDLNARVEHTLQLRSFRSQNA
jgi:hypothetical protein